MITAVRNLRSEMNVAPGRDVEVVVRAPAKEAGILNELAGYVRTLARVGSLEVAPDAARPEVAAAAVVGEAEVFLSLAGAIDLDLERERLSKELARIEEIGRAHV